MAIGWLALAAPCGAASSAPAPTENAAASAATVASASSPASAPATTAVAMAINPSIPRLAGRLAAADIGLVINTADPYSVAVGAHYQRQRKLSDTQVLRLELPRRSQLTPEEFGALQAQVAGHFGTRTQALALAWVTPYAVACNSLAGALAMGFDAALCQNTCRRSRASPLYNSASAKPWRDHGIRPAMHLAAPDIDAALELIDRGVAADGTLGQRGAATVRARLLLTGDRARNVRAKLYPSAGLLGRLGVMVDVGRADDPQGESGAAVIVLQTGQAQIGDLAQQRWTPGALADHFTSFGGQLDGPAGGQSSALGWIAAGATASHGSASEPCAHLQKFPHPQLLLGHYLQGASAIEAYWKSVAWPQQSVFIGEPLAAPFARAVSSTPSAWSAPSRPASVPRAEPSAPR